MTARPWRYSARRGILVLTVAVVLAASCWIARERLLVSAAWFLRVDDAVAPADYLVVLGGSANDRPFAAADLFHAGMAPKVLVFVYRPGPLGTSSETELYERILGVQGVPPGAIDRAPGVVRSTWDEAQSLRRFLASHRASRVVIVTSAGHTRRARWTFERVLAGIQVDIRMAAARHPEFGERNWWRNEDGLLSYVHEFVKFPYYVIRYAIGRAE